MAFCMGIASIRPARTWMESAKRECHSYGCPYLPQDIYYDSQVKTALAELRTLKRDEINEDPHTGTKQKESLQALDASGRKETGTLTLIGYKGGSLEAQVNQDRAFCIVPYTIDEEGSANKRKSRLTRRSPSQQEVPIETRLMGVFDGHANLGEHVSQFVVTELPKLLASKLKSMEQMTVSNVTQALIETFIELDEKAPAEISGGCTASVVFQHGRKVYFANAGDSRSFLVVYRKKAATVEVIYITREDKPNLQDERERVESRGGKVYLPFQGTSRVLYTDPVSGMLSGLAMSRSIGDWEVGKVGVIPDPIVHVIDIPELVEAQLKGDTSSPPEDDVHIFAVSATDGMMDFISPEAISHALAASLYAKEGLHLLTTLEQLIYIAAQRWEQSRQGRYRDDIAVAVSQIRIPTDGLAKQ